VAETIQPHTHVNTLLHAPGTCRSIAILMLIFRTRRWVLACFALGFMLDADEVIGIGGVWHLTAT
jgi:hypothetical protein